jgi:hypothetical protein
MAYIDEATFELLFPHRDASASPGTNQFTQWIKAYTAKINGYLGVSTDICAVGDDTHEEESIVAVIANLIEAHYVYVDDLNRTPLSERGNLTRPYLSVSMKQILDNLKGQDESIEAPAFNFRTDTTQGGYD